MNIDLSADNVCETKYDVPKDVATEMLAGMFAHNLDKALYVTVTKDAVTVVQLLYKILNSLQNSILVSDNCVRTEHSTFNITQGSCVRSLY